MKNKTLERLLTPPPESVVYEDDRLYVALASFPMSLGHTVVVWKGGVSDIHLLPRGDFEYLMDMVDATRNALMSVLAVSKVYLLYMDEVCDVHWHLVPRHEVEGLAALTADPKRTDDFSLATPLKKRFVEEKKKFVV
ncbi:MAG: hypothetical protein A3C93_01490 [Candidatus Lloydbacteria bacterium RIFCSPHIGHO2_02_FULL_54_17]|uniref:HIT domain-containing protein n=1 Tax=Candidatus Lloydbacteria bacterium RIFCSPHIGHO2_02_FULL_54_17 TaxID=1798664 RepID=A0A1G2DBT3_9BACT|nr:MAG: hypothetical protein A2762_00415 [Candidatus Lloydbacteria bacterium RIFCSPHIGHO2_01_FULL_54_11]OGZ11003.1 MAG: hypothetical protein A3C93_01490 [Candidatus Lloydbacteria bacterium RIFCSPHIGHO2_02_FULL_54_17]OGZ13154.1 MAG: hypothetical protein A2948_02185 [Candidatus Lloydbacteria bacterium RIFCSPLOWO2_01_FULL_54_18]OGZ15495.1 MAG: hypothetical protein A3H76_00265 [Candidatus Lloydbacteria bacterium RIFCSPLOWO2_02_FULL_54_12]